MSGERSDKWLVGCVANPSSQGFCSFDCHGQVYKDSDLRADDQRGDHVEGRAMVDEGLNTKAWVADCHGADESDGLEGQRNGYEPHDWEGYRKCL